VFNLSLIWAVVVATLMILIVRGLIAVARRPVCALARHPPWPGLAWCWFEAHV